MEWSVIAIAGVKRKNAETDAGNKRNERYI
jgi:hypothetical protein